VYILIKAIIAQNLRYNDGFLMDLRYWREVIPPLSDFSKCK
jgi:hypothetical protein